MTDGGAKYETTNNINRAKNTISIIHSGISASPHQLQHLVLILTQHHYAHRDPDPLAEFIPPPSFYDNQNVAAARNKYEKYLKIPAKPYNKSLEWWKNHQAQFSILSRIALDLLSVPLISAEYKRIFSAAKILINDRRNRIKNNIIEIYTLLQH